MISADMLQPIVTALTENIEVILPVGMTVMGSMIGVGLIPRLIYKFLLFKLFLCWYKILD